MKLGELRYGNIVSRVECETDTVIGVTSEGAYFPDGDIKTLDTVYPIALTEEWMLKLGFKLCLNQEWLLCKGALCLNLGNNNIWEYGGKVLTGPIYVHQLQNLYFALTGQELEIKK